MAKKKEIPSLLKALDFVALAQRDKGAPHQTHVSLENGMAIAFDGVLAAGHKIDEALVASPHTMTLVSALRKCSGTLAVTQLDSGRLSIKSGKFRALVPCVPDAIIQRVGPDQFAGAMDERVRNGLDLLSPIIVANSRRVVTASALLRAGTVVATNGQMLLEYWHGLDLPPGLVIPKVFINALTRVKKPLTGFGFSDSSFTVFFDDESWLRTQLYVEKYADTDMILQHDHTKALPLPEGFFEALNTVLPFIDDHRVRLRKGCLQSHDSPDVGARYEVEGLDAEVTVNAKNLKMLEGLIDRIDLVGKNKITFFYGKNLRGCMSQIRA